MPEKSKSTKRRADDADDGEGTDSESESDESAAENEDALVKPSTIKVTRWSLTQDDKHYFVRDNHARVGHCIVLYCIVLYCIATLKLCHWFWFPIQLTYRRHTQVQSAAFNPSNNVLVVGFATGSFSLYELPYFTQIHSMRFGANHTDMHVHTYLPPQHLSEEDHECCVQFHRRMAGVGLCSPRPIAGVGVAVRILRATSAGIAWCCIIAHVAE